MKNILLKNKNILITGISGFVGQHLEKKLLALGSNVYGISRNPKRKSHIKGNVTSFDFIKNIVRDKRIDICFHLAGEALVENGQNNPYETFRTNLIGTLNILEVARVCTLDKVIIASTTHVYGDRKAPYFEKYSPRPSRPYETSKTCTDLIAQSYANTFSLPVLISRFVNIYGPGDMNFSRLIPKTIQRILSEKNPVMWGGDVLRQYLYIDDAIRGYLDLATVNLNTVGNNRIFNFGCSDKISVKELIQQIIKISGKNLEIQSVDDEREAEVQKQYVSWYKARKLLKWSPRVSLVNGLTKTVKWYEENAKNTIAQI